MDLSQYKSPFATRRKNFPQRAHTGSGTHPASPLMATGVHSQRIERPGRETDDLPPSTTQYQCLELCLHSHKRLHSKHMESFTFNKIFRQEKGGKT